MATETTTVMLRKDLHRELVAKLRKSGVKVVTVIDRLVEMYLNDEVTVVIPPRKI